MLSYNWRGKGKHFILSFNINVLRGKCTRVIQKGSKPHPEKNIFILATHNHTSYKTRKTYSDSSSFKSGSVVLQY